MADPIWKKKLMEALGFTPRYDIDIQQHGKPRKDLLPYIPGAFGASGLHPGAESGYMGGIVDSSEQSIDVSGAHGYVKNQNPTQVGWNKPSIKGGAGGGFKRVLKHLAAMESPGPDWSLEAKKSGPASPWGIANAPWKALSPGQDWLERQRKKERPA